MCLFENFTQILPIDMYTVSSVSVIFFYSSGLFVNS